MPVRAGVRAAILRQASRVGTGRGTGGGGGVAGGAEGLRVRARGIFLQAGEAGSRFCGGGAPNTTMASSLSTIQSPVSVDPSLSSSVEYFHATTGSRTPPPMKSSSIQIHTCKPVSPDISLPVTPQPLRTLTSPILPAGVARRVPPPIRLPRLGRGIPPRRLRHLSGTTQLSRPVQLLSHFLFPGLKVPQCSLVTDAVRYFQHNPETIPTRNLLFPVAASYSAKGSRYDPVSMTFNFNPYNRVKLEVKNENEEGVARFEGEPRENTRPNTGQDAFFISRIGGDGGVAVGVADGVGGYSFYGIDSADFSHTLCENMALLAHSSKMAGGKLHPRTLLHNGYQQLLESCQVLGGASTACVGTLQPNGVLMVANLGDSGFIILRHGKVHYASIPQTHAFNTPYQLAVVPPETLNESRPFRGGFLCDLPKDAQVTCHNVENGDVLLFATDGVWDNLFPQEILRLVSNEMVAAGGWSAPHVTPVNKNSSKINPDDEVYASSDSASTAPNPTVRKPTNEDGQGSESGDGAIKGISPTQYLFPLTSPTDGTGLQSAIARTVTAAAKSASLNSRVDGPFAKELRKCLPGEHFRGGKRDDISVIVCVVVDKDLGGEGGGGGGGAGVVEQIVGR